LKNIAICGEKAVNSLLKNIILTILNRIISNKII
jgi:hypothetical protein